MNFNPAHFFLPKSKIIQRSFLGSIEATQRVLLKTCLLLHVDVRLWQTNIIFIRRIPWIERSEIGPRLFIIFSNYILHCFKKNKNCSFLDDDTLFYQQKDFLFSICLKEVYSFLFTEKLMQRTA